MIRARAGVAGLLLALMVFVTGCNPFVTHRSIGVEASEVSVIEFYEYAWGEELETVNRLTLDSEEIGREVVDELMSMFRDVPTTTAGQTVGQDAAGHQALGVRYRLFDGSVVEVTRVLIERNDVVVFWPDGSVSRTEWGSPDTFDYYAEFGVVEQVDAEERPKVELPG